VGEHLEVLTAQLDGGFERPGCRLSTPAWLFGIVRLSGPDEVEARLDLETAGPGPRCRGIDYRPAPSRIDLVHQLGQTDQHPRIGILAAGLEDCPGKLATFFDISADAPEGDCAGEDLLRKNRIVMDADPDRLPQVWSLQLEPVKPPTLIPRAQPNLCSACEIGVVGKETGADLGQPAGFVQARPTECAQGLEEPVLSMAPW